MSLAAPPSHEVATSSMDGHLIAEPEPGHAPSPDNMDGPSSSSISPSPARDGVVTLSSEYNQANESAQNLKSSSHVHAHVPGVANPTTTAIDHPISDSHLNEAPVESKLGSKSTSFWRLWMVELVLAVCSLCSFAIIVAVLRTYDGEPLPNLPMHISLNTFLAFFTTFSKFSFLTPIYEALSQWKWNLFAAHHRREGGGADDQDYRDTGRPLADFQILASASRGFWGSWKLLVRFKWRHFVSAGAMLSILGLFTSPITQQMIAFTPKMSHAGNGTASVPISKLPQWSRFDVDTAQNIGLRGSFTDKANDSVPFLTPECTTSNCTFEPYSSFSICLQQTDISHHLQVNEIPNSTIEDWHNGVTWASILPDDANGTVSAWNASLPNGLSFVTPVSYAFWMTPYRSNRSDSIALQYGWHPDLEFAYLLSTFLIYSTSGNVSYPGYRPTPSQPKKPWTFRAIEAVYYACVNQYETTVNMGTTETAVTKISISPLNISQNKPADETYCVNPPPSSPYCDAKDSDPGAGYFYLEDTNAPGDVEKSFKADRRIYGLMAAVIKQLVEQAFAWCGLDSTKYGIIYDGAGSSHLTSLIYGWEFVGHAVNGSHNTSRQFEAVNIHLNNVATSMSNGMRVADKDAQFINGTAWSEQILLHIQWGWVAFLASEMVLSYIFLAITIWHTCRSRIAVFKSSELATLLTPVASTVQEAVGPVGTTSEDLEAAEKRAESTYVVLKGHQFVLV